VAFFRRAGRGEKRLIGLKSHQVKRSDRSMDITLCPRLTPFLKKPRRSSHILIATILIKHGRITLD
jgi:hypothetical protein